MKLYIFNPDADMALANNSENYIPPASIRRMTEDLALLPVWYAQPGSAVLAPSAYNADYLKLLKQLFPIQVELVTLPELPNYAHTQVMPWGWSPALRKRLLKSGIREHRLPSSDDIDEYREWASREYSASFGQKIAQQHLEHTCGEHFPVNEELFNRLETLYADKVKGACVLKPFWSGSGKGLCWCWNGLTKTAMNWAKREIREHGGFIMEPIYNKVEDFAMEFYSNGQGRILFTGYSSFTTDAKGGYRNSTLAPDALIENRICRYVPLPVLIRIREQVQQELEQCYSFFYTGPVGVDMMVCKLPLASGYAIHPHVEVNLRMTMGMVAHQFYDRFVTPGMEGRFYIENYSSPQALQEKRTLDIREHPLKMKKGKMLSGCLELVPVTPKSCSRAYVIVG